MAELKIEPNPTKDALGGDPGQSCRSYQRVGRDGYGRPLTFSFHSAACSGCGLAFTAFGTLVGGDGVVERVAVG